ncbi:hypothetical protein SLEP1_g26204 [Rubroshorea leprosula]|uniref:Uncharacterized protein n=1 Tax=Rubroshorea leprosula TaxID=152421 RepID=A0AAV5JRS2_9ROSI|nr:hypothetical protein SLEP1_g26204 [Rubroshorea leprosula]
MSSEETLSVGGSEEVRALEYGDMGVKWEIELIDVMILGQTLCLRPVGVKERACSIPQDHWMLVYAHYLAVGLSLNSDEEEEVEKLVKKGGEILDIMYLTSSDVIDVAELYGPNSLSEVEMDKFLGAVGGMAIPKKPRKKQRLVRLLSEEMDPAQKKKKKVAKEEVRGDEVVEFVPRPPPVELDLVLRKIGVTTHGKVDRCRVREEVLIYGGSSVVKHALKLLVHNGMEEHIANFFNSSSFDNIVNLYRLSTAILAFTDYGKKVKVEYLKVDVMKITFEEQEEEVEENSEMEEGEVEAEGTEVEESQPPLIVETHPVPFKEVQPPLPIDQQPPPLAE